MKRNGIKFEILKDCTGEAFRTRIFTLVASRTIVPSEHCRGFARRVYCDVLRASHGWTAAGDGKRIPVRIRIRRVHAN